MPAVAYACLIRLVRALEELEDLDRDESHVIRAAADARLLADEDWRDRMVDADQLLHFCEEYEKLTPDQVELIRAHLSQIRPPAIAQAAARERKATPPPRERRSPLLEMIRSALGRGDRPARAAAPAPAPAVPTVEQLEAMLVIEHAERLLAFEAWLDANGRR